MKKKTHFKESINYTVRVIAATDGLFSLIIKKLEYNLDFKFFSLKIYI